MKRLIFFISFCQIFLSLLGQIKNPSIRKSEVSYCRITLIETNDEKTVVFFTYQAPSIYQSGGWVCAGENFFIRDNESGKKYFLIKANNIPVCPKKYNFTKDGETLQFNLEFQPLPRTCKEIDIIESLTESGFNYYGVSLLSNSTISQPEEQVVSETISYSLNLTMEGKLRTKPEASGEVIQIIPIGESVGIYSKENDYFKVSYRGKVGYINDIFFNPGNKPQSEVISNSETNNETQRKECKSFYRDGQTYQYYVYRGISITMTLSAGRNYGKYFIAYVAIENLSGKSFNFNPNYITAAFENNGKTENGEVLSSNEYLRIVNNRQAWNSALVAFGESSAANQAGYSSSSTTSNTSYYSNSYGSASGYYGNTYGNVYGSASTYGNATTRSNTQSYNGAANYAAHQNAQQNINNFQSQQYQIRQVLNDGYLKLNTINNEQRLIGQINIKYKTAKRIKITIPVNGENYDFWWSN